MRPSQYDYAPGERTKLLLDHVLERQDADVGRPHVDVEGEREGVERRKIWFKESSRWNWILKYLIDQQKTFDYLANELWPDTSAEQKEFLKKWRLLDAAVAEAMQRRDAAYDRASAEFERKGGY